MKIENFREALRFGAVGVVATAIHYLVYYLLLGVMSNTMAFTLGYVVSFACNYVFSSRYTFKVGMSVQKLLGFGLTHLNNYILQICLLNFFLYIGVSEVMAPLPVYAVAVPVNFFLVRFVLKRRYAVSDGYLLFLIIVGLAMFGLNYFDVPTLSDDMIYRFVWTTDDSAPVETIDKLSDLVRSQTIHYQQVNGRIVAHTLAQAFFAFIPPMVLQLLNSLLFVLLLHFCALWLGNVPRRLFNAVAVCFLLFIVFQGFRTSMLWGLGTFNYLWVLVMVMGLLLWLRRLSGEGKEKKYICLLFYPLAFLAGCSHEALSLPVSFAFFLYVMINRKTVLRSRLLPYMLLFLAGTAICVFSPGIINRSAEGVTLQGRLLSGVLNYVFNVRILWLLIIVLLVLWKRDRNLLSEYIRKNIYTFSALLFSAVIVFLCGTNLERVAFFTDFMAMLLLLDILAIHTLFSQLNLKYVVYTACTIMVLFYVPAYLLRKENSDNWLAAEQQMMAQDREMIAVNIPVRGENGMIDYFRDHYANPSFDFGFYCSYMGFDSKDINMRCAARLYGKKRLYFLPNDVVNRAESDSTAYDNYELDANGELFVWKMHGNVSIDSLKFVLNDEDLSKLSFVQRFVAYRDSVFYLDDFHYEVVSIGNSYYLVFTRPTTNIYRRINDIKYTIKQ